MYYKSSILVLSIRKEVIKMSLKKEIKKVSKLINKSGYIPIVSGDEILFIINKITGKEYRPKFNLKLGGEM